MGNENSGGAMGTLLANTQWTKRKAVTKMTYVLTMQKGNVHVKVIKNVGELLGRAFWKENDGKSDGP